MFVFTEKGKGTIIVVGSTTPSAPSSQTTNTSSTPPVLPPKPSPPVKTILTVPDADQEWFVNDESVCAGPDGSSLPVVSPSLPVSPSLAVSPSYAPHHLSNVSESGRINMLHTQSLQKHVHYSILQDFLQLVICIVSICCADPLLLELTVQEYGRRIETLEATVEKLVKTVESLQSQHTCAEPPLPLPPQCPIIRGLPPSTAPPATYINVPEAPPLPPRCPAVRNTLASNAPPERYENVAEVLPPPRPPRYIPPPRLHPPRRSPSPVRLDEYENLDNSLTDVLANDDRLPPHPPKPQSHQKAKNAPKRALPSTSVDKSKLTPAQEVIANNVGLVGKDGKMTTLAVLLARESFFGEEVMGFCTAKGHADKPALPHAELMELKEVVKGAFPHYWNAPHAFESQWVKCMDAISQACKRARNKSKKKA